MVGIGNVIRSMLAVVMSNERDEIDINAHKRLASAILGR